MPATVAVKLTPEQFEMLRKHLSRFPKMSACPICDQRHWDTAGVHGGVPLAMESGVATSARNADIMPVIALACTTCGYVREFAWLTVMGSITPESYKGG
jgi:hypothetical protein